MYHEEKFIDGILMYRTTPDGTWYPVAGTRRVALNALRQLSDEERHSLLGYFCRSCSCFDPDGKCQCWNDE